MEDELSRAIKTELKLSNEFDEVIKAYISDCKVQIKNYLGTEKLTSTLILVIKAYTTARLIENEHKYQTIEKGHKGLDEGLERYEGILSHYKKASRQLERGLYIETKRQRLAKDKSKRTRKNKK